MTIENKDKNVDKYNYLKTKKEMLDHYAEKEPMLFKQYDGFYDENKRWDDITPPDYDGDNITSQKTCELMSGSPEVRVLISPQTKRKDTIRLLLKIVLCLESGEKVWDKLNN